MGTCYVEMRPENATSRCVLGVGGGGGCASNGPGETSQRVEQYTNAFIVYPSLHVRRSSL